MNERKKAAILTVTDTNYGDFLQALGLKEFISNIDGYDADILKVRPKSNALLCYKNMLRDKGLKWFILKGLKIITHEHVQSDFRNKMFETEYEHILTGTYTESKKFPAANDLYDIFISGSAFTWCDHKSNMNAIKFFFLSGIKKPKISYAPSIGGGANFNKHLVKNIVPLLNEYDNISVRETAGIKFLHKILGNDRAVFHAIDPTLLLSSDDWDNIIDKNETKFLYKNKEYIFVYLLGFSQEQRELVKRFAKSKNLEIITFPHLYFNIESDNNFADIDIFDATPYEMLLYIKNAKYIFTDSFHCSIFSGIFHKEFFVFNRINQAVDNYEKAFMPRIDDLLDLYGVHNRYIPKYDIDISELDKIKSDWNALEENLGVRRSECQEWLKNALNSAAKI